MKKLLYTLLLLIVGIMFEMPQTLAQTTSHNTKKTAKKHSKNVTSVKKETVAPDEDGKESDISSSSPSNFECELAHKLTIYRDTDNDRYIALRWNKRLYRLSRVETKTGANRFENHKYGLVWIDIPSKGMLLDSQKGHQLANECKPSEQRTSIIVKVPKS